MEPGSRNKRKASRASHRLEIGPIGPLPACKRPDVSYPDDVSEAAKSFGPFVEAMERARSVDEVCATFLAATAHLGFEFAALFTCAEMNDPRWGALSFARIPQGWLEHYKDRRYYEIDPVFATVQTRATPFSWNDPSYRNGLTEAQTAMLAESSEAGLVDGVAIPIKSPDAPPSCCTLVPAREGVDPASYQLAHSLGVFAHLHAWRMLAELSPATQLPPRERECLLLAAQGKSDWAIGEVLGLSERTVHHAIERAKKRFGVATRTQAIVRAIAAGEFSATDAIGPR